MCFLQELHLFDICPLNWAPDSGLRGPLDITGRLEYHDECRLQAGKVIREVVSQLPKLRCLRMNGVKVEDTGDDFANLHPWTQLE